ncbi:MAG: hypothetical protein AAF915_27305 [Cyanobacteria bacterium P01_D01_bin.50]
MNLAQEIKSLPIVTYMKKLTSIKYNSAIAWTLLEDFNVVYESHCPEKKIHRKQTMSFDDLPLQIKILIAQEAIKSPRFKTLDSRKQLKLVLLAVKESAIESWL